MESSGCRIDKTYLEAAIRDTSGAIADAEAQLRSDPNFKIWRRRFGDKTKPGSYDQLATVVFRELRFPSRGTTASGDRESASEAAFEGIDLPLVRHFLTAAKLKKARDTYLLGIQREMVRHADGNYYIHPSYNLNVAISGRSSVDLPNYQNQPNRNPQMAEIVRRCYVARGQLGEIDYGQIEVRVPCAYTFDENLIAYVTDPTKDMHRDMACQIFKLKPGQVSKPTRTMVKSPYVFATFYGSYYGLTAPDMWEAVDREKLQVEGGGSLRDHMTSWGMTELGDPEDPRPGTWVHHVKAIDEDFWGSRFRTYAEWKRKWYADYCRTGGFVTLTGFAVHTPLDKKSAINNPIQGSAFHLLLWSLIQLNKWLRKHKMKSMIIGEIHDSMVLDIHPPERDDVFHAANEIMTERIKRYAPWLNIPLIAEAEICPIGGSWFDKYPLVCRDGVYLPQTISKWEQKHGAWALQSGGVR